MKYFKDILNVLNQSESLGVQDLPDGTRLVGHVPQIAPLAYLHVIFRALSPEELPLLERAIKNELPPVLREFFLHMNGLNVFLTTLAIHGLRKTYDRTGSAMWQPFGMEEINVSERINGATNDLIFFASYKEDGSLLYTSKKNERVFKCSSTSIDPVQEWPSFQDAIGQEIIRISKNFDEARGA